MKHNITMLFISQVCVESRACYIIFFSFIFLSQHIYFFSFIIYGKLIFNDRNYKYVVACNLRSWNAHFSHILITPLRLIHVYRAA